MSSVVVILLILFYLAILFYVAFRIEKSQSLQKKVLSNPYVYSLSLAVYCSAWTFFGSVGMASQNVLEYITIYLGPTIMAPLFYIVLRKMIRISKIQSINTLTDFISARYGKSILLGRVASICIALGVIPYVALQIKAVDLSIDTFLSWGVEEKVSGDSFLSDVGFYFVLIMGVFILLFTTRGLESKNNNGGLVGALVFESVVKLIAFLLVGVYIVYFLNGGVQDLFQKVADTPIQLNQNNSYTEWFGMLFLSGIAVLLLPRQFEMAVVENVNERQINKAMWVFPLYLMLINLFVFPIAIAGNHLFEAGAINPDMYVLGLPLQAGKNVIAGVALIGGFSAASGMVMVSTHAISKMLSNSIIMPMVIDKGFVSVWFGDKTHKIPGFFRRISVLLVLLLAYGYYVVTSSKMPLVSIGLMSFVAIAQLAPTILLGMFWKGGSLKGALSGLLVGFVLWFFHLVYPSIVEIGVLPEFLTQWTILENTASQTSAITSTLFWSLFGNLFAYVLVSIYSRQSVLERNQAEIFVDVFKYSHAYESSVVWKGTAYFPDIKSLLEKFIGTYRTEEALTAFSNKHNLKWDQNSLADGRLVTHAEKLLTGVIGASSARIMVATVVKEERIGMQDVVDILKESQELIRLNKELMRKSEELRRATEALKRANQKLKDNDELKDEFLYTVTHEMRTPLTSIRALSEILSDHGDELDEEQKEKYISTILKETNRMSRLISQVLDLENFESGKHKLQLDYVNMVELIEACVESMSEVIKQKSIKLKVEMQKNMPQVLIDFDRITQVILNLLSNAVKYCDQNNGEITITAYQIENKIKFNVKDNGKGIPEELHKIIFEKFFQARNQTIRKPKGSGLGLAISKNIIQLHEGNIWVENVPEGGAKFSFTIPIKSKY
ncbi:MAG: histidine kinase [Crocinitomicaceae bacterium]|nr:histidine kinase [Crocinitomicaceae bacterium]